MVQKKVANKLGIQASSLKKDKITQAKTKHPLQNHDSKIKGADLKIKKMKKSRSIKRSDPEISLGSSPESHETPRQPGKPPPSPRKPSPESHEATRQPRKPPPMLSPAKTPSPGKLSPNYMKSTSSSEGRKMKKVRSLTKAPSFKNTRNGVNKCSKVVLCENIEVQRATCSSTLKDSKFPPYLMLNPGATEAIGTSVMKVCPYNYCSLNGHHHNPTPPLKGFLSSRRRILKTQKVIRPPEVFSPRKAMPKVDLNEDFFIEIHVREREINLQDDGDRNEDCITENTQDEDCYPITSPVQVQTWSEFSDNGSSEGFLGEYSNMEWEEGDISAQIEESYDEDKPGFESENDVNGYLEEFIADKLPPYFHEEITECQHIYSDADSVPDSESTQPGEEQIQMAEEENNTYSEAENEIVNRDSLLAGKSIFDEQGGFSSDPLEEITDAGNEDLDSYQNQSETDSDEDENYYYIGGESGEEDKGDNVTKERKSSEDTMTDFLPQLEDLETSMVKEDNKPIIASSTNFEDQNDSCVVKLNSIDNCDIQVKTPEMKDIDHPEEEDESLVIGNQTHQTKDGVFSLGETDSNQELLDSCNKLKRSMRCKKEDEVSEEIRPFNPREPNFLPMEPDPDAEKVDLRHQEIDERRNSEEWMLDYALRKAVNQLAPARKRKVALLVEAFEAVTPIPKCEPHLRRNSSGFTHATPIQACS